MPRLSLIAALALFLCGPLSTAGEAGDGPELTVPELLQAAGYYHGEEVAATGYVLCLGEFCMIAEDPSGEVGILLDIAAVPEKRRQLFYGVCTRGSLTCKGAVHGTFMIGGPTDNHITVERIEFR